MKAITLFLAVLQLAGAGILQAIGAHDSAMFWVLAAICTAIIRLGFED